MGGWISSVLIGTAILVVGIGIAYGSIMWRNRTRDRQVLFESDRATKTLYHPRDRGGTRHQH